MVLDSIHIHSLNINVCEKDRAGDTAYTEDIAHQCKNWKEREEEYIVIYKKVMYNMHITHTNNIQTKSQGKDGISHCKPHFVSTTNVPMHFDSSRMHLNCISMLGNVVPMS